MMDTSETEIKGEDYADRRGLSRADTERKALFSSRTGRAGFWSGVVVNISPDGMQIQSSDAISTGDEIDIEVYPKESSDSDEIILVRGTAVWCAPQEDGLWAIGIRLRVDVGSVPAHGVPRDAAQARVLVVRVIEQLQLQGDGSVSPLAYVNAYYEAGDASSPAPVPPPKRRISSWRKGLALTALLAVMFFLFGMMIMPTGKKGVRVSRGQTETTAQDTETSNRPDDFTGRQAGVANGALFGLNRAALSGMAHRPADDRAADDRAAGDWAGSPSRSSLRGRRGFSSNRPSDKGGPPTPSDILDEGQRFIGEGKPVLARAVFRSMVRHDDASAIERFLGQLGQAQAMHTLRQHDRAAALLSEALATTENIPDIWIEAAESFQQRVVSATPETAPIPWLQQALDLSFESMGEDSGVSSSPPPTPAQVSEPKLVVEINATDYSLTLYEGGVPLATFPVGLGRDASTPLGLFRVANMIVNPDWYNRGQVVKAGDPNNPLGNRWVGLGDRKGATPYGIHPTSEAESIGQNLSKGCVRMRPQDAMTLFEMIEIGTPVRIVP